MTRKRYCYEKKRRLRECAGRATTDLLRPNGFDRYPKEIYDLFLSLIDNGGKVIDLGCGNGTMLKHLVTRSRYELIPYDVDFIEESIEQAKRQVLPEYAENF